MKRPSVVGVLLAAVPLLLGACSASESAASSDGELPTLVIGGIPDQEVALLEERFDGIAEYMAQELDIPVRYQESTDYAAVVTAFSTGDIQLGWFGGLTGVQARLETPGARAVAQRPIDQTFRSVFIASADIQADGLGDLAGTRFTFGSESSTSGHLMPRYFLGEAGIDPEADFDGQVGYSGSHDKTFALVESGSFEAGVLNESVWDRAVAEGDVDTAKVREVSRTEEYFDYHWVASPEIDETYGEGTTDEIVQVLTGMDEAGAEARQLLELFEDEAFVETTDKNYARIEEVARDLGLVGQ